MDKYQQLYTQIGYSFKNSKLLDEALTHPSCLGLSHHAENGKKSYEQLEFLGDSVLTFIITDLLVKNFPDETEGQLTKRRAALINTKMLAHIGRTIEIGKYLSVSRDLEICNEPGASNTIEDTTEALLGAMYLDGGMQACKKFVSKHWAEYLHKDVVPDDDPKTYLQEWSQKRGFGIPQYSLVSKAGYAHAPVFVIKVEVPTLPTFDAAGPSKKLAEKAAAKTMIEYIKANKTDDK